MLFTPRDCIYTSKITKRCSSVEIILIKMKCPYRELFKFPKITIQKSHSLLVEGTRTVLTSRLANKTMSHYAIVKSMRNTTCIFFRLSALELCCDASDRQVCRRTGVQTGRCADGQVYRRTGVQTDRRTAVYSQLQLLFWLLSSAPFSHTLLQVFRVTFVLTL